MTATVVCILTVTTFLLARAMLLNLRLPDAATLTLLCRPQHKGRMLGPEPSLYNSVRMLGLAGSVNSWRTVEAIALEPQLRKLRRDENMRQRCVSTGVLHARRCLHLAEHCSSSVVDYFSICCVVA